MNVMGEEKCDCWWSQLKLYKPPKTDAVFQVYAILIGCLACVLCTGKVTKFSTLKYTLLFTKFAWCFIDLVDEHDCQTIKSTKETEKLLIAWQIVDDETASGTSCKKKVNNLLSPCED